MDSQEISAFAAYTSKKKPKKLDLNQSLKLMKKKKKMKLNNMSIGSVMDTLIKADSDSSPSRSINEKTKRTSSEKKHLIKSILKAQKDSIFKDGLVTTKEENLFLKENALSEKNSGEVPKSTDDISKPKELKKNKLINGEPVKNKEKVKKKLMNSELVKNKEKVKKKLMNSELVTNKEKVKKKLMNSELVKNKKKIKKKLMKSELVTNKEKVKKKLINDEPTTTNEKVENSPTVIKSKISLHNEKSENECDLMEVDDEPVKSVKKSKPDKLESKPKMPNLIHSDSVKIGEEIFSWLLSPLSLKEFFENCWEQKPLHIEHKDKNYFKSICSLEDFKSALREHDMYFTRNIDVTSYIDGERRTENPEGKAKPALVWDFFKKGRSIRLLNPQTFIQSVRILNTTLQEFFHCFVGANIYLTPPGTQGFAPHYDDIEAFVLQLEGEKHWKLYNPRSPEEVLPRESSKNFREDEIGEPILEVTLQPGDLLYFPRGIIHQAKCLPHIHSLHITVSCYQKNSWADLLEKVLPVALQKAINEDVEFRKGLPIGYLNSLGMIYSDKESVQRKEIIKKFEELAQKVLDQCPLDAGVDQMGANYIHDALPPSLNQMEKLHGADRNCSVEDKNVLSALKNSSGKNLKVKLIRATSVRLVSEEEEMVLYYTTDNSLVFHEFEASRVVISTQWAQAVEYLIHSYPKFVGIKELPVSNKVNKPGKWKRIVDFVYFLWQKGLLLFDQPLLEICS